MTIYVPGKVTLKKEFTWNESVWNPSMLSTALWLDAADASTITESGGAVSQWDDKSGNSRHAAEATNPPSLTTNGLNLKDVVTFDGVNDKLVITSAFLDSQELLIACVVKENNGGYGGVITSKAYGTDTSPALNILDDRKYEYAAAVSTSTGENWAIVAAQSISSNSQKIVINSIEEVVHSGASAITNTAATTDLGKYRTGPDPNFGAFDLGELIVVTGVNDLVMRQKIEGYLAHKWGLTANLPSDHPYKLVGPTP